MIPVKSELRFISMRQGPPLTFCKRSNFSVDSENPFYLSQNVNKLEIHETIFYAILNAKKIRNSSNCFLYVEVCQVAVACPLQSLAVLFLCSVWHDVFSVITFTTADLYVLEMNIQANKVCKIAKNAFEKCMYSIGEHLLSLVSCYRSSVMLKSMSSGYQELSMVISELRDVRSTAKAFAEAQYTAAQDMVKWSLTEENPAIRDTFVQLSELSALWTEVQKEFAGEICACKCCVVLIVLQYGNIII
jgi:hypothetical protein